MVNLLKIAELEEIIAKGLSLQLILAHGLSLNIPRPTIEQAKEITKKYRPWAAYLVSFLFHRSALQKVNWDNIIDIAMSPEMMLNVYNDCLEERNKQNV